MIHESRFENFEKILANYKSDLLNESDMNDLTERFSAILDQVLFVELSQVVCENYSIVFCVQVARLTNATYSLDEVANAIDLAQSHTFIFTDFASALVLVMLLVNAIE